MKFANTNQSKSRNLGGFASTTFQKYKLAKRWCDKSGAFTWNSKKQDVVARCSVEAKYVFTVVAANQAIWLKKILADL
ncbi:hypothetical protein PVK06_020804 [Gossypium arboreum]|uniref:Uncharacterized protein n=1 Tax=Gossypium arboreum TaxID=29729 RepID=A0ABR0PNS6_GOSAR|nr:hypothetical protein PVK06_020804 [Gossypium arboreum]